MFSQLKNAKRLLWQADLKPVQGDRFQPTGFADLGAATYQLPEGTRMLLLESPQSMANRLEATILDHKNELIPELTGVPYIIAHLKGDDVDTRTNSLIEAHRVNSPFIISDPTFKDRFKEEAHYGKGKPLNWQNIARTLFKYDVNSLIHGVFLANLEDGRVKMARALTSFIEASGVREVVSGGVKNNPLDPSGRLRAKEYEKDVYGNVPYQRIEFSAEKITVYFNLDIGLLKSYGLPDGALEFMTALSLYKATRLLTGGLRLRTACDLTLVSDPRVTEPEDFKLINEEDLLSFLKEKIPSLKDHFANPPVTHITTEVVWKKEKEKEQE